MLKKSLTNLNTGPSLKIGVLGGGQLGRMMIQSAIDLDMRVEVMDPSDDAPCKSLTHRFVKGDFNDADAVYDFGKDLDVITIEIEHVSVEGLQRLEDSGVRVIPKPNHIALIQDKGLQKQIFADSDIPTADFILVEENGDFSKMGFPLNPPASFLFLDFRLFLFIVVLVATIPSIFKDRTISTISEILFFDRSGDILRSIGFGLDFVKFSAFIDFNISIRGSLFCSSLKFGVLGELTFTTK